MGKTKPIRLATLGLLTLALWPGTSTSEPISSEEYAKLVFRGGDIYTLNDQQPWAEAVAIRDGKIVFVGSDDGAKPFIAESTEVVDIGIGLLLPGFHDSHMHPMRAGNRFLRCQLQDLTWPKEVLAELERCEQALGPGQWLRGVDLAEDIFSSGHLHKSQLDVITPDRPAFITNQTGFLAWSNSIALEQAGINADTPNPIGGVIEREAGTQQPNGVLRRAGAGLIYGVIPELAEAELRKALRLASEMANSFGITSSSEAQMRPENWQAFVAADQAGEITLRVQGSQAWDFSDGLDQLDDIRRRRDAHESPFFQANTVKLFLDSSLMANHGAALLEPYSGTPDDFGIFYPEHLDNLVEVVRAVDAVGMYVHMHALGDRAVRSGLDSIEAAVKVNPPHDRRHHIAHLELVHPDDLPRFAALGVTANYQALWAHMSAERREAIDAIGPERAQRMLTIHSMLDSGARVVLGSDWISDSMNPLYSIQVAVTRRTPGGNGPAWLPEQRITLEEAIRAYTIEGAWLAGHEQLTGSIEVGKAADLVLLEHNLFEIDEMEISRVRVLRTLLDGKTVYRRKLSQP